MVIDCLIIIKPWLEKILSGEKDMEIRGSRFSSISTSFVRDFCESLHGTPLDFMHLKQYTAKVIQNVRRTERSMAMMLSGSYYYIATARFYAGRYFAVPVFPSHEA